MTDEDKDAMIQELKRQLSLWRGRAVEAVETACQNCRNNDLSLCRFCRMEKIRKEAGHG